MLASFDTAWCFARTEDGQCPASAAIAAPIPLCRAHQIEVALQVVPGALAELWSSARAAQIRPEGVTAEALPVVVPAQLPRAHASVVYFIQNGNRVKIGHTTRLPNRLATLTLRKTNVLLLLQGGSELESALHARFQQARVDRTEWFRTTQELLTFIREKQQSALKGELVAMDVDVEGEDRLPPGVARQRLLDHIRAHRDSGEELIGPRHFKPVLGALSRSRAWVSGELKQLAAEGALAPGDEPGDYLIVSLPGEGAEEADRG
ncbi:hypothetical protein GCM10010400_75010 [Streptomyces aculeolatus]|uniref:GIY-YIG nuclease family protein n=1 Tax=Streptomyces aculeolatus TaxID=270689 RepID=UPI001CED8F6D|nr:GIY-YIG nuclease family protein [Streptomyces aculeolatus]